MLSRYKVYAYLIKLPFSAFMFRDIKPANMSAQESSRAATAAKIMKALSRPGTTQSRSGSAWKGDEKGSNSLDDPEKGLRPKSSKSGEILDPYLEEELASAEQDGRDNEDGGPQGCWSSLSKYVSSIW